MSDYQDLCSSFGLCASDPDAIDTIIAACSDDYEVDLEDREISFDIDGEDTLIFFAQNILTGIINSQDDQDAVEHLSWELTQLFEQAQLLDWSEDDTQDTMHSLEMLVDISDSGDLEKLMAYQSLFQGQLDAFIAAQDA